MQQELALLREGSLCIRKRGEVFQFSGYDRHSQKTRSIMNDPIQIYDLARRAFLENSIKAIQENVRRLSELLEKTDGARHELLLQKNLENLPTRGST